MPANQTAQTFGTFIGCMDGRIQQLAIDYARDHYGVVHLDKLTEPAMVSILAGKQFLEQQPTGLLRWTRFKAEGISKHQHGSRVALVLGHHKCAGHGDCEQAHRSDVVQAVEQVSSWECFDTVVGLFGAPDQMGTWSLEEITFGGGREQSAAAVA